MGDNHVYIILRFIIMYVLLIISTYTDLKSQKVLNVLTLPTIVFGMVLPFYNDIIARVIFLIILFLLSFLPAFGGGDIKLLMGVLSLRGVNFFINSFFLSLLYILIYIFIKEKKYALFLFKKIPLDLMHIKKGNFNAIGNQRKIAYAPFLLIGAMSIDFIIFLGVL